MVGTRKFDRIYKYPLAILDYQVVKMPKFACSLSVQDQDGVLTLWVAVDTSQPMIDQVIRIVGTGNPTELSMDKQVYVGTAQMEMTGLVWHVFADIYNE